MNKNFFDLPYGHVRIFRRVGMDTSVFSDVLAWTRQKMQMIIIIFSEHLGTLFLKINKQINLNFFDMPHVKRLNN
jgi:hypothetical protein